MAAPGSKIKILVVDDEPEVRAATAITLNMAGYQVLEAENGEEGLLVLQAEKPDLVILDLLMPKVNGLEVCRILRDNPETHLLPIIILSATHNKHTLVEGLEVGANVYLNKPFLGEELLAHVRNLTDARYTKDRWEKEIKSRMEYELHDMKTPLINILNAISLHNLVDDPESADVRKEALEIITRNANHLLHVLNNLLDVTVMEGGRFKLKRASLNPYEIILSAVNQVQLNAKAKGLGVDIQVPDDLPDLIGDRDGLIRVLVNLLSNAVKFANPGTKINVTMLTHVDGGVLVEVQNTGKLIPMVELENLFLLKDRANEAPLENATAGGMGLTFCRMMVGLHGGRIWANSQPETGTVFCFNLPGAGSVPT